MTETKSIPAISDPAQAAAAILEHVAAIDALLNGVRWVSPNASDRGQDALVVLTDVSDCIKCAVDLENEWHKERGV